MNILAQLPASMKERVNIKRIDARKDSYRDPDAVMDVADDVEVYIEPGDDEIQVGEGGRAQRWLRSTVYLGVPNFDIREGDVVCKAGVAPEDGMRVFRVQPYGKETMQLILRTQGIL